MADVAYENDESALRLGDALRHRRARPGNGAIVGSIVVHALAIATFFVASRTMRPDLPKYQTVAVHLVSPPPTVLGPPEPVKTTAPVVSTPKPEPTKTEPAPKPKAQTQSAVAKKVESKPADAKPAQGPKPKPGPVGGENLNIQQEGPPFPYPEYLENVIFRLSSSLRWQGAANLTAQVVFYVKSDGSIGGIKLERSSGNLQFDLAAVAAVENVGRSKVLGPLPKGWQGDRLPIQFTFVPNN
jgi:TonB family protein